MCDPQSHFAHEVMRPVKLGDCSWSPGSSCPALRSEGMILGGEGVFQQPQGSRQTCSLQGHPPDPKATQGSHSTPAHTEASLTQVLRPGHPQDGAANALNTSGSGFQSPSLRPQAGAYSPGPAGHELVKQTKVCCVTTA